MIWASFFQRGSWLAALFLQVQTQEQSRWSSDLQNFDNDGDSAGGTTVTFAQGVREDGQVTVTATIVETVPPKLFLSLQVSQP